ncbi:MAG: DUF4249 family protein [Cyclobacteriaceae bacterium]
MKKLVYLFLAIVLVSCETDINAGLPQAEPVIAFDAWLYHKAEQQVIDIYTTNPYFDSSVPVGIGGATVTVVNVNDPVDSYTFTEEANGKYVWNPANATDSFATIGNTYTLNIDIDGTSYTSLSHLGAVPTVDSITWRLSEATSFTEEAYFANFWSRDLEGDGDTYWIKSWKNGVLLNKPDEINIAYDAAFSVDGNADGLIFIQPIRETINPFEFDDNDVLINPFELGDSIYVEINSITQEAFYFLQQVQTQTARDGGFGELFAVPLANIQSNIFSGNESEKVVGFFCVSASHGLGKVFLEEDIRITED